MVALDFSRRSALSELMDSDETDFVTFRDCLVDLAKVNTLTLAYRPTLRFFADLDRAGRLPRDRAISVVDCGSGYGDMLRKLDGWAVQRGLRFDLVGVDLNPWSARAATEVTAPAHGPAKACPGLDPGWMPVRRQGHALTYESRPIRYVTANLFDYRPLAPIDIVISSLFTHHLDDAALVRFVAWMEANARIGWFVNDLHRHPLPYHVFRTTARALRFHHFVQHDGPISIMRAFVAADWHRICRRAELPPGAAEVRWRFPFRLCVARAKS
jgi:SAM-dependent methyltransferase